MAAEGTHVIVFSLEMKPVDLAAKAVSRQLYTDWHETSARPVKGIRRAEKPHGRS